MNNSEIKNKYTYEILGVKVSVTDMKDTISRISDHISLWKGEYICVANVHTTVMAHESEEYKAVQNNAVMILPDGGPLSSLMRKNGITTARRVTGPDLMKEILRISPEHGWSHFFYGSSEATLEALKKNLLENYPETKIAGMISPPFRTLSKEEDSAFAMQINEAKPDFLWVGLGAPKQEIWMAEHKGKINALMIGVGAAFDYEAGNIKRAPMIMQRLNLEWLYRLLQDPVRLFKRYFITNSKFLWLTRK